MGIITHVFQFFRVVQYCKAIDVQELAKEILLCSMLLAFHRGFITTYSFHFCDS